MSRGENVKLMLTQYCKNEAYALDYEVSYIMGEASYNPAIGSSSSMTDGGYQNYGYNLNENQAVTGFGDLVSAIRSPALKPLVDELFGHILNLYDNLVENIDAAQSIIKTFLDDIIDVWKKITKGISNAFMSFFELVGGLGSIQIMRTVSLIVVLFTKSKSSSIPHVIICYSSPVA